MLTRDFDFLRGKYREMILPTLLMVLSDKICLIIDVIIIGQFIHDSAILSAIELVNPFTYSSAVIYTLFGVGGNLLALRARAVHDDEKSNHYFTIALLGSFIFNIAFTAFIYFFSGDILRLFFDMPPHIINLNQSYLRIFAFYFPLNSFIVILGYFARSDRFYKLPFFALLISNISNIILSTFFMGVLKFGVEGSALGSVIGFIIGSAYISTYFIKENRDFYLTTKIKIHESIKSIVEFIINTPEIFSRLFVSFKITFYTILCSHFLGTAGLIALLIYDNSETMVYMFLSAISKVMSPIVAVFYKEKDYEAVEYIIKMSLKHVLYMSIPISIVFIVYPEILIYAFSLDDPVKAKVVCTAIRITSFGLAARCISILLSTYSQAIEENKISYIMRFSHELIFAFAGAIVLIKIYGPIGIWYALVLADVMPVIIYATFVAIFRKRNRGKIKQLLLLSETNMVTWTYVRGNNDIDSYVNSENKLILLQLEKMLDEKSPIVIASLREILDNILKNEEIENIDFIIRYPEDVVTVTLTYGGRLLNPITENTVEKLAEIDGNIEYGHILGFNRAYINVTLNNPNK